MVLYRGLVLLLMTYPLVDSRYSSESGYRTVLWAGSYPELTRDCFPFLRGHSIISLEENVRVGPAQRQNNVRR